MTETQATLPSPKRPWYRLTPDRLLATLLTVEALLWLSDRFQWFMWHGSWSDSDGNHYSPSMLLAMFQWWVNSRKGWMVQVTAATCILGLAILLLWFLASRIFRWQFQWRARSLLVLVVVVAVPSIWLAEEMKNARKPREAVKAIKDLGGCVRYDCEPTGPLSFPTQPAPACLMALFGVDFFSEVCFALVSTDAATPYLRVFPRLDELSLFTRDLDEHGEVQVHSEVTDVGLKQVGSLYQLQHLGLSGSKVTDDGLQHLEGLTQLRELDLGLTRISDAGLEHLKGLTQLDRLRLCGTLVTDAGVKELQQTLPNCKIEWEPPIPPAH